MVVAVAAVAAVVARARQDAVGWLWPVAAAAGDPQRGCQSGETWRREASLRPRRAAAVERDAEAAAGVD
jgi:hypothetical protein